MSFLHHATCFGPYAHRKCVRIVVWWKLLFFRYRGSGFPFCMRSQLCASSSCCIVLCVCMWSRLLASVSHRDGPFFMLCVCLCVCVCVRACCPVLWASKLNSVAWVNERTIPTERPPLVGEVSAGSLRPYSQLYSRGWVDPVPDPLLLRKSGSSGDWTWTSGSVARNSDH
jgi:hypothetical protein